MAGQAAPGGSGWGAGHPGLLSLEQLPASLAGGSSLHLLSSSIQGLPGPPTLTLFLTLPSCICLSLSRTLCPRCAQRVVQVPPILGTLAPGLLDTSPGQCCVRVINNALPLLLFVSVVLFLSVFCVLAGHGVLLQPGCPCPQGLPPAVGVGLITPGRGPLVLSVTSGSGQDGFRVYNSFLFIFYFLWDGKPMPTAISMGTCVWPLPRGGPVGGGRQEVPPSSTAA